MYVVTAHRYDETVLLPATQRLSACHNYICTVCIHDLVGLLNFLNLVCTQAITGSVFMCSYIQY